MIDLRGVDGSPSSGQPDRDRGQVAIAAVGFAIVVVLLLAVVVSASRVFLAQRDLAGAADSAAAVAAQAVSEPVVYGGGAGPELPIDPAGAQAAVDAYVAQAGLAEAFDGFAVVAVVVRGTQVTVTFGALAPVPMGGMLSDEWSDGLPITGTATARSPFTG